jgi:ribulose 1,5-bisphosphate synthetase/thiazole synthase
METTQRYDVVVAGGGVAGLTAAAYCAKAGLRTLVCERADKPGGLVGTFPRARFSFDAGIRAFEDSGVITPMLRSLGSSLEFVKNPVTIGSAAAASASLIEAVCTITQICSSPFFPIRRPQSTASRANRNGHAVYGRAVRR